MGVNTEFDRSDAPERCGHGTPRVSIRRTIRDGSRGRDPGDSNAVSRASSSSVRSAKIILWIMITAVMTCRFRWEHGRGRWDARLDLDTRRHAPHPVRTHTSSFDWNGLHERLHRSGTRPDGRTDPGETPVATVAVASVRSAPARRRQSDYSFRCGAERLPRPPDSPPTRPETGTARRRHRGRDPATVPGPAHRTLRRHDRHDRRRPRSVRLGRTSSRGTGRDRAHAHPKP